MRGPAKPAELVTKLRPVVQLSGFVRKELAELMRQPRLLAVLVIGPFLVLLLFAIGYDQQSTVLRTAFVGPDDTIYEDAIDQFADDLSAYVTPEGYSSDLVATEARLADGEIDLIVVFPPDPAATVLEGDQAVITVLHDKLDPIQQTAVEVSAQVAVQELNAIVLEELVGQAQTTLVSYDENLIVATEGLENLERAVAAGDDVAIREHGDEDIVAAQGLGAVVAASQADLRAARDALDVVEEHGETATTLDPRVIVRPFISDTENLLRARVGVNDFFAPGAIALLVQHMVLTFAALGLVSDRTLGLFEVFRVAPIGPGRVLAGKYLAYTTIGGAVAAALIAAVVFGLDVPFRGSVTWVVVGILGLILASIGLGLVLSLIAQSDTQAVQFSMLVLLAGLFFGGFFLDLDAFRYPVKALSWVLPVTHGVRLLRDTMLRGIEPASVDVISLGVSTVVFGLLAWALLARRLRRV